MLKSLLLFLLLFFLAPIDCEAARELTISSNKTSLFGDEEITISASPSGFVSGESIYIKAAFYKAGSTNYFGFTKSGDNWIKNGATATDQRQIQLDGWDGIIIAKSDFSDSGYQEKGDYNLKIGFYYAAAGGNLSSVNWSENNLIISLDQPEPTEEDVPEETNDDSSDSETSSDTNSPPPTQTPSKPKLTITPSKKAVTSGKISPTDKTSENYPLITKIADKKKMPETKVLGASNKNYFIFALPIGFALLLVAVCIFAYMNWEQIKTWIQKE